MKVADAVVSGVVNPDAITIAEAIIEAGSDIGTAIFVGLIIAALIRS